MKTAKLATSGFQVNSSNVKCEANETISQYVYDTTSVETKDGSFFVTPKQQKFTFKTTTKVPKTGVMLIGWGGNNGSTLTSGVLANRHNLKWMTKRGEQSANYYGSLTQCATTYLGTDQNQNEVVAPFKELLPMVNPNDLVIGGWDISKKNLYESVQRAHVMEPTMYIQLKDELSTMVPLPAIFDINFVAPNQLDRADNVLKGSKKELIEQVRQQMRDFKSQNKLDQIIVLWTANTELYNLNKNFHFQIPKYRISFLLLLEEAQVA